MTDALENIINKNNSNKMELNRRYNVNSKGAKWRLIQDNIDLYLVRCDTDEKKVKVTSLCQIAFLLNFCSFWYITNISLLKKFPKIINKYVLDEREWALIKDNLLSSDLLDSFKIIKVNNMKQFLSKSILVGNYSVIINHLCYSVISNGKDIILLSDIILGGR